MNERVVILATPPAADLLAAPARIPGRLASAIHHPGFHASRIAAGAGSVGTIALMIDSTVLAALIAGGFTLVNTLLTVWLTGLKRPPRDELAERRRNRRRRRQRNDRADDDTNDDVDS